MSEPTYRLGDLIDDYCPRCRLLLNHAVASMVNDQVVKVICQTCYTEHPYRRGEGGKKKKLTAGRTAWFGEVLAKTQSPTAPTPKSADPAAAPVHAAKKKRAATLPRYISRHQKKPPPGKR